MATVLPKDDFDAEAAAETLKEAMDGFGTDEEPIIAILASHCNEQRQEIKDFFKQSYGQNLEDRLKSELGGCFEQVALAVMDKPRMYDAKELRNAMKGVGTDEATLIEIMVSRTNEQIEQIKELYKEEFDRDLEEDLMNETSGYFRRFLVCQCNAGREEFENWDDIDWDEAREDAQKIYDAGEGTMGTEESEFMSVLCTRSFRQLRAVFRAYKDIGDGKDIEDVIDSEMSGSMEDGMKAIVRYANGPSRFFAKRIYDSMKGAGTEDGDLIRLVVSRSEIDLAYIKEAFPELYKGGTLGAFIADDCGGDYKHMLLALAATSDD